MFITASINNSCHLSLAVTIFTDSVINYTTTFTATSILTTTISIFIFMTASFFMSRATLLSHPLLQHSSLLTSFTCYPLPLIPHQLPSHLPFAQRNIHLALLSFRSIMSHRQHPQVVCFCFSPSHLLICLIL